MRIVITGATGNVGTALVRALLADDADHQIVGIARRHPHWDPGPPIFNRSRPTGWISCSGCR